MRYAEMAFLILLTLYHLVLLAPRGKRLFPANYLVFLAGMALAWNLGLEGLRWQTIPPLVLLLIDLAVLAATFRSLRGKPFHKGFLPALGRGLRVLTASAGLLLAAGSAVLALAFPLPQVGLSGGLHPSYRIVRFPPTDGQPGLDLHVWYPAGGDLRALPRPQAETTAWQRTREAGGLPTFWQSYLANLPTNLIRGGKMAMTTTKYPVVYAALPPGESPADFGYLFEDLASRGFLVAAAVPLPKPLLAAPPFVWASALNELAEPITEPLVWLEPDQALALGLRPTDHSELVPARRALEQLDDLPGDPFFNAVDWNRQGLWAWGRGPGISAREAQNLGLRCQVHFGGQPREMPQTRQELWVTTQGDTTKPPAGRWTLEVSGLNRADLADSAFLKPYLAFFGLKSQPDSGHHGDLRQFEAGFFQYAFFGSGDGSTFSQSMPEVPGLRLSGQ